ncbi:MAG: hypothetical protein WC717_04805 [Candidatus Micrarchaeia archaeon]|jgi:hypothetical protein
MANETMVWKKATARKLVPLGINYWKYYRASRKIGKIEDRLPRLSGPSKDAALKKLEREKSKQEKAMGRVCAHADNSHEFAKLSQPQKDAVLEGAKSVIETEAKQEIAKGGGERIAGLFGSLAMGTALFILVGVAPPMLTDSKPKDSILWYVGTAITISLALGSGYLLSLIKGVKNTERYIKERIEAAVSEVKTKENAEQLQPGNTEVKLETPTGEPKVQKKSLLDEAVEAESRGEYEKTGDLLDALARVEIMKIQLNAYQLGESKELSIILAKEYLRQAVICYKIMGLTEKAAKAHKLADMKIIRWSQ